MELKEAIAKAKNYVSDVFLEENISGIGLEEIQYERDRQQWDVTIGFFRPSTSSWDSATGRRSRVYKTVVISNNDGTMISIRNRDVDP